MYRVAQHSPRKHQHGIAPIVGQTANASPDVLHKRVRLAALKVSNEPLRLVAGARRPAEPDAVAAHDDEVRRCARHCEPVWFGVGAGEDGCVSLEVARCMGWMFGHHVIKAYICPLPIASLRNGEWLGGRPGNGAYSRQVGTTSRKSRVRVDLIVSQPALMYSVSLPSLVYIRHSLCKRCNPSIGTCRKP